MELPRSKGSCVVGMHVIKRQFRRDNLGLVCSGSASGVAERTGNTRNVVQLHNLVRAELSSCFSGIPGTRHPVGGACAIFGRVVGLT